MNVRRISDSTIKRLFALSGNRCSFPQCTTRIVQESGTITGRICHIRAASPGGPRYDPSQTDADRNSFSNLLLLCSVHHDIVDAEEKKYAAELLAEIKDIHERSGNIELSQQDSFLVRRLIDHCPMINASGEAQVMVASPGAFQAKNVNVKLSKS